MTWPEDGPEWLDLMWYLAITMVAGGMVSTVEAMSKWDDVFRWGTPTRPDRLTWGESPEAARAEREFAALMAAPVEEVPSV